MEGAGFAGPLSKTPPGVSGCTPRPGEARGRIARRSVTCSRDSKQAGGFGAFPSVNEQTEKSMKLRSWNDLAAEVSGLPAAVGAALATGRPELLANADPATITPREVQALLSLVRVLLETNQALQHHCAEIARRSYALYVAWRGIGTTVDALRDLANFREPTPGDE